MADIMAYAFTGMLAAFLIGFPFYGVCLLAEHIINKHPRLRDYIDKIS